MRTPDPLPAETPLSGWNEIAEYLHTSRSNVRRWARRKVNRMPWHKTLGKPWASPLELQVWLRQNTLPGSADGDTSGQE